MAARLTGFDRDGLRFEVSDRGPRDGEVVIALHGFPQTRTCWDSVTPILTAAGYRVLAPDQRGFSPGARPRGVEAYRLDHLAGDVLALADAAAAERFHVLGHDWGGGVAWYLASRHADRVRTVSVASTPHPRAMIRSFRGSQALRSWYFALFRIPVLPEFLLLRNDQWGLRQLLAMSRAPNPGASLALMADGETATAGLNWYRAVFRRDSPVVGGSTWRRCTYGATVTRPSVGGRLSSPPIMSAVPTPSRLSAAAHTGSLRSARRRSPIWCWRTCGATPTGG